MKAAGFQESNPCRGVIQKHVLWHDSLPTSPDVDEFSKDWTEYQEDLARHKTWKLHEERHKIRGSAAEWCLKMADPGWSGQVAL